MTFTAGLIQLVLLGAGGYVIVGAVKATFAPDPDLRALGWKVLAGTLLWMYAVGSRTSFLDLAGAAGMLLRRILPGGGKE